MTAITLPPYPRPSAFTALILLVMMSLAVGCENEVDTSENLLPHTAGDTGGSDDVKDTTGGDTGGKIACSCLKKGMWYRFNKLKITEIDLGFHPVMITLNALWATDIKNYELNFYAEVLDVSDTQVTIRVVNGARKVGSKDETCVMMSTEATVTHPRSGCALQKSAKAAMNVYAGTPAHPKNCTDKLPVHHAIPVRNAIMQVDVSSDCSELKAGKVLDGSFSADALQKTCTCLTTGATLAEKCGEPDPKYVDKEGCSGCNKNFSNLKTLLEGFGKLDYKCKSPSGGPAACLKAEFAAKRIDKAPPNCN